MPVSVTLHRPFAHATCPQLDLLLAYERFGDSNGTMLYPVNIMRNYARLQVRLTMQCAANPGALLCL